MTRYLLSLLVLFSWLTLISCSQQTYVKFNHDLKSESWAQQIETNPSSWSRGADEWFLSGNARAIPDCDSIAMSTMQINAPYFSNIKIKGDFKVQIFGTNGPNTVYIYGPSAYVVDTAVSVKGDTLYLNQRPKASPRIRQVIIRIGVNRLNSITQAGRGLVEGIRINSDNLVVTSVGSGNIYLAGHMNLRCIRNFGNGCINIFGANSPDLEIKTGGRGTTNVSGNVGISSIWHTGASNINVIGANSDCLKIYADGCGKIGISGIVNLRSLKARGNTRVYVCRTESCDLNIDVSDNARVGIAGTAQNLHVDANENACVGLRSLCSDAAYVRTGDNAHVNVAACKKIFASASGNSSIYFFGPEEILTRFVSQSGFVMRMCTEGSACCARPPLMLKGAG